MDPKENLERLSRIPNSDRGRLEDISRKILILKKYSEVIDKHPEDFGERFLDGTLKKGTPLSIMLLDYILMEISTFYTEARKLLGGVETPPSQAVVERFRNKVVAHPVYRHSELVKLYKEINSYTFEKIYTEWEGFRNKAFELLNAPIKE